MNISSINTYDSDLLLQMQLICERRGVKFKNIESVAFGSRLSFGLADNTAILPAVINTFYFIPNLWYQIAATLVTAPPYLEFSNLGIGSAGLPGINFWPLAVGPTYNTQKIETNSIIYRINGNTAGVVFLGGTVLKITTE